ncbi:MAG: TIM barrel protein [Gammaproteobacteria bacterium]
MPRFSANLGFLWTELSLPDAVRRAAAVGFDAVECHFPYNNDPLRIKEALEETHLSMLSINTSLGINGTDDFGVLARVDRQDEAKHCIDKAIEYAAAIGAKNINAVAGKTEADEESEAVYRRHLLYACEQARPYGITILIEPMNQRDVPNYHVKTIEQAITTIKAVGVKNLKLLFDCYHTQISQGDLTERLRAALPYIGHIQFASVPGRQEPELGEVNYLYLFSKLDEMGWKGFV